MKRWHRSTSIPLLAGATLVVLSTVPSATVIARPAYAASVRSAVTPSASGVPSRPAVAPPASTPAFLGPLVDALRQQAQSASSDLSTTRLTAGNWRMRLRPLFDRTAVFQSDRVVPRQVGGAVLGRVVTLPTTLDLEGDTTIVADSVVLSGQHLKVEAHGHLLAIFPITSVRAPGAALNDLPQITVDVSGAAGQAGADGTDGSDGGDGADGADGQDGATEEDCANAPCDGTNGNNGDGGSPGQDGTDGATGDEGYPAGSITFAIPCCDAVRYSFIARGGLGGAAGKGGNGGSGGNGGHGGNGGNAYAVGSPGSGGDGGLGGDGGNGGHGGFGGRGGAGGTISVTYLAGFDPALISADASGGGGGDYAPGGFGGVHGAGGTGGAGGYDYDDASQHGPDGSDGSDGQMGAPGAPRGIGDHGIDGLVTISPS